MSSADSRGSPRSLLSGQRLRAAGPLTASARTTVEKGRRANLLCLPTGAGLECGRPRPTEESDLIAAPFA